jgi:hypothetical protein
VWLMGTVPAAGFAAAGQEAVYADMAGHWAKDSVANMSSLGILDGFPDGTFRPEDAVTADQFVKMLLLSYSELYPNGERGWKTSFFGALSEANKSVLQRDYRNFTFKPDPSGYWAKPYVDLAEDLNILAKNQFADYKVKLKREDVAEIVYYTLKETEFLEDSAYSTGLASQYGDYLSLSSRSQRFVAEVTAKGIMEGYPNGYFGAGLPVTRAEALRILERLTDKSGRVNATPASDGNFVKMVPTADGSYKKLIFPSEKMLGAYDVMLEAAALRGTNYDMQGTVLRLFKDAAAKSKGISANGGTWDEASLWLEPGYRIYGITVRLQDGMLARNEESIGTFAAYIFGNHTEPFLILFNQIYGQLAEGQTVENRTVTIGGYSVEIAVQDGGQTAVFSILEKQ